MYKRLTISCIGKSVCLTQLFFIQKNITFFTNKKYFKLTKKKFLFNFEFDLNICQNYKSHHYMFVQRRTYSLETYLFKIKQFLIIAEVCFATQLLQVALCRYRTSSSPWSGKFWLKCS